jgi:HEAT repeat protein
MLHRTGRLYRQAKVGSVVGLASVLVLLGCSGSKAPSPSDAHGEHGVVVDPISKPASPLPRVAVAGSLSQGHTPSAGAKALKEYLADLASTNARTRVAAMGALTDAERASVPELLTFVEHATGPPRVRALVVLGSVATTDDCVRCEGLLRDTSNPLDYRSRAVLLSTLGKIGGRRYLELLKEEMAKATNDDVRGAAAVALAEMGDTSGTEVFLRLLETKEGPVKQWAAQKLSRLYRQDLGTSAERWREWLKENAAGARDETPPH